MILQISLVKCRLLKARLHTHFRAVPSQFSVTNMNKVDDLKSFKVVQVHFTFTTEKTLTGSKGLGLSFGRVVLCAKS